ncbi:sulfotransferase, partial [Pseudomonas sp. CCC4.4]|nr:sulfotransferase [Pseudomonas sp. CCC4.4]
SMGSIDVDFIGRQESLIPDFLTLCEHLNVKAELQHINRTSRDGDENRDFCSAATRRKVREVYARDYELFAYD